MGRIDVQALIEKQNYYHLYQPLYYLSNWSLCGYEALLRSQCFSNPELFFGVARKKKKLFEVDSETLFHAAVEFFSLRQEGLLFLNVFPSTLLQRKFLNFFEKFLTHPAIWGKRVVLEINEGEAVAETKQMQQVINYLRMNGVRVAIDDVGKGAATLQNVIELEPEYLKLDRYFAKGLSTSANKQKLIGALVEYCRNQTHLVLEGIEQPEDLAVAKLLGIQIAQGYLLGRPEELIDQRCVTTQTDMSAN